IVDPTTGVPVNGHLDDYKVPTIADVPEIVWDFVDIPDENLPNLGAKGLGEPPIVPTAAAIANAFAHATGRRAAALPLTPARVIEALRGGTRARRRSRTPWSSCATRPPVRSGAAPTSWARWSAGSSRPT